MKKFCRFDLRTTDADAARAFYNQVLGHDRATIWPLHEQALARGAKPHWLGQIGVDDVDRVASEFEARGATRLGPTRPTAWGGQSAVLRDPGGALFAVSTPPPADVEPGIDVIWHVLNTTNEAQAIKNYCEIFGWAITDRIAHEEGVFQRFSWQHGGANIGVIADIATRPGVHPQWLYFFPVDSLDTAIASVRAAGGITLTPSRLPNGDRICVCDDPQGAAFALCERSSR